MAAMQSAFFVDTGKPHTLSHSHVVVLALSTLAATGAVPPSSSVAAVAIG